MYIMNKPYTDYSANRLSIYVQPYGPFKQQFMKIFTWSSSQKPDSLYPLR